MGRMPGSRAIPAESPCPPAWAQGHPRVTLLFTCLQQTWAVGSGTFGSCSAPCAVQPGVSKGLTASPATSSSSAVELPSLTWLLAPLGHQHWEATLSCPVYTQHSTLRNTPREDSTRHKHQAFEQSGLLQIPLQQHKPTAQSDYTVVYI